MAKKPYQDIQVNKIGDRRDAESQKHRRFWFWGTVALILLALASSLIVELCE